MRDFEEIYANAEEPATVSWARLAPNPVLAAWLAEHAPPPGRALVAGCGYGDDAAHLASLGHRATGFDIAPTAIRVARERFGSVADFVVADWFAPPATWHRAFDLVVEIGNVQALPEGQRESLGALADLVAPGGTLYVRCYARPEERTVGVPLEDDGPPWPLTRGDLALIEDAGLQPTGFRDDVPGGGGSFWFEATYRRPPASPRRPDSPA